VEQENNSDKLKGLRNNYKSVFESEEGKKVLKDLERVCLYRSTTFDKDSLVMAFQEGLRAVYLHITTIKDMDIEELERISNRTTKEE
jgi:hypothetical protein